MRNRLLLPGLLALLWAATASASNSLQFGPAPDWVKPVALPPIGKETQAAVKLLLDSQQIKLTPKTVAIYVDYAVHIQTPQGLSTAGTVTAAWDPDMDSLTINKVEIHRGNTTINILSSGQTFTTARREANLDYATLDDTLTAVLEPADLQIGDTVEVAYTLEHTDPVLAGIPEAELTIPTVVPISKVYIRAIWPSTETIKWQATKNLIGIQPVHTNNSSGITLTMTDVQPILQPTNVPSRFLIARRIDFTGSGSWTQLAQRLAPLYQRAATLSADSPLHAEIAHISAATADPKQRAAMALALVEDKVRYVLLAMNEGGLIPASADLTWSRRFGDCKGKTVLLLALLHGLGIKAEPVAVNMLDGDGLDSRLPMIHLFNHVLVRVVIAGNTYWLDGTRFGDAQLDRLHEPFYHWGLPLVPNGAQLVKMVPPPPTEPQVQISYSIDATGGVTEPAPLHAQASFRGEAGVLLKMRIDNATPEQRDRALRDYWSNQIANAQIRSVSEDYDKKAGTEQLKMNGTLTMDWSGGEYDMSLLSMGNDADFKREPGPNHNAPYAVAYPYFTSTTEVIKLPFGGQGFSVVGPDTNRTLAGMEYRRHVSIDGGNLTGTASVRSVNPEFPANESAADQKALRDLANSDVEVHAPTGHQPTDSEIAWGLTKSNSTADDYVTSGNDLLNHHFYADARADYNAALALNAKDAWALAGRGLTYAWLGDDVRANQDFKTALAIDPHNWVAFNGLGLVAYASRDDSSAIAAFTEAIRINPKDEFALHQRALTYWRTGENNLALHDLNAVSRLNSQSTGPYWIRALIFKEEGKISSAARQAHLVVSTAPKDASVYFTAAAIYDQLNKPALAAEAFRHTLPSAPTAAFYLARAMVRPWRDLNNRRADIDSALKINPKSTIALVMLAKLQMDSGKYNEAIVSLTDAINKSQGSSGILTLRSIAYEKSGRLALANADLANAKAEAKDGDTLNNICWELAAAGVRLDTAVDECNAALIKMPEDPTSLDRLGFVLIKLRRYDEAIAAYTAALKSRPWMPTALYGRGICELRTGNSNAGQADIRSAMALSYIVADEFAHYGIQPE